MSAYVLDADERYTVAVALRHRFLAVAIAEARLDHERPRVECAPAFVQVVHAHDGETHVAYATALRTMCGRRVERAARHQDARASCRGCRDSLAAHRLAGLVAVGDGSCAGLTKRGDPCKRPSLPELGFCPSHKGLAA